MSTMTDQKNRAVARQAEDDAVRGVRRDAWSRNGVTDVFGIVGSAYMDALDLFPLAGIRFISVAHEQGGGPHGRRLRARVRAPRRVHRAERPRHHQFRHRRRRPRTGRTRRSSSSRRKRASMTLGLGGFQETEQLPIFSKITKYQAHVNNRARMAELTGRAFDRAHARDGARRSSTFRATSSTATSNARFRGRSSIERGAGGEQSLDEAAGSAREARSFR